MTTIGTHVNAKETSTNTGLRQEATPGGHACSNCKEGFITGNSVYCSIDGRFHPLYDNYTCKRFIPKQKKQTVDSHNGTIETCILTTINK